jgi:hypothetical protein
VECETVNVEAFSVAAPSVPAIKTVAVGLRYCAITSPSQPAISYHSADRNKREGFNVHAESIDDYEEGYKASGQSIDVYERNGAFRTCSIFVSRIHQLIIWHPLTLNLSHKLSCRQKEYKTQQYGRH